MKITNAIVIVFIVAIVPAVAQNSLRVTIKNIRNDKGEIRIGLFNNERDFLKNPMDGKVVKSRKDEVTVVFENLPSGDYALSVIHDENKNQQIDTNAFGIPKEGFGFGNNAMGMFGPPSFERAKISLRATTALQEIKLKYY